MEGRKGERQEGGEGRRKKSRRYSPPPLKQTREMTATDGCWEQQTFLGILWSCVTVGDCGDAAPDAGKTSDIVQWLNCGYRLGGVLPKTWSLGISRPPLRKW
jgi:hypothetical protein